MNSINNNLMAQNVANTLNSHYGRLSTSVERLSSGLRINSAADDAAGLAIRELMRADIAATRQGVRNANDAISLIQVADGALGVIDEKLIRMKELAEQAATGTYDSTQRLMIDSEFQAMGEEIDRIARATDFNGIKLLDGSLSGTHNGYNLTATGAIKVHFGSGNDSADDYYYINIKDCTTQGLGLYNNAIVDNNGFKNLPMGLEWINNAEISYDTKKFVIEISDKYAGNDGSTPLLGIDSYSLPIGLKNVTVTSNAVTRPVHKAHVSLFDKDGTQLTGPPLVGSWDIIREDGIRTINGRVWWNANEQKVIRELSNSGLLSGNATYDGSILIHNQGDILTYNGVSVSMITSQTEIRDDLSNATDEIIFIDNITSDLVFFIGGHDNPDDYCNRYKLKIEGEFTDEFITHLEKITGNDVPPPITDLAYQGTLIDIKTQEKAQQALTRIDDAIVIKDKVRANLGAMQNRLENTVTNLTIQGENLQTAECRISDVDVATEMTQFVRNQVLTQSAVAMLGQANSYPHMLAGLIQG